MAIERCWIEGRLVVRVTGTEAKTVRQTTGASSPTNREIMDVLQIILAVVAEIEEDV